MNPTNTPSTGVELQMSYEINANNHLYLKKHWNRVTAGYIYRLIKVCSMNTVFTKVVGQGDGAWANRTSEHYGLKIMEGSDL